MKIILRNSAVNKSKKLEHKKNSALELARELIST